MLPLVSGHFKQSTESSNDSNVIYSYSKYVGKALLNKPKALNSIDQGMMNSFSREFEKWKHNPNLKVIIFAANGGKAFSAGGDLRSVYNARLSSNTDYIFSFYRQMYTLFYQASVIKPIQVALWDGIVIGAGAGLTLNAPIKIATEYATFSMPEGKIGLYLGIGGGYYFSAMKKNLGVYIGLTGASWKGKEIVEVGLADFFVKREKLQELEKEILSFTKENTTVEELRIIVRKYAEPVSDKYIHEDFIDRVFGKDSVEEIYKALEIESQTNPLAKNMFDAMKAMSPLSLKIIFEQIKRGKAHDLKENLRIDFRIGQRAIMYQDFLEGARCLLIDKGSVPNWEYKSVFEVPSDVIEKCFAKLPANRELNFD